MYFPTTQTEFLGHSLPFLMRGQRGVGVNKEFPFLPPLLGQTKKKKPNFELCCCHCLAPEPKKGFGTKNQQVLPNANFFFTCFFLHWANSSLNNNANIGLCKKTQIMSEFPSPLIDYNKH